jgi:hypothetical protein
MPGVPHRTEDIPFDPASGEVIYLQRLSQVRSLPEHTAETLCQGATEQVAQVS